MENKRKSLRAKQNVKLNVPLSKTGKKIKR